MRVGIATDCVTTAPDGVGGAVGVEDRQWYIAIVRNNTEKSAHERLALAGYESYLATQTVYRLWRNGRRARIEQVVIPSTIFIRCTEHERKQIVALPFISRFMTNKARGGATGSKAVATVPDSQIATLRFMLGQSDTPVTVVERPYRSGDRVRVVRGRLRGLEGEVVDTADGRKELIVSLDILGCAKVTINPIDIEPLP